MWNQIALSAAAGALVLLSASACDHERSGETSTTGAEIIPAEDAVNRLTARRCERENDCKHVGEGRRYEDNGTCEREVAREIGTELRPAVCTYGVRGDRLDECMQSLRKEKCERTLGTVSALTTCRTGRICLH
jgi:hypothetical protein